MIFQTEWGMMGYLCSTLRGSYTLAALSTSAVMGTVEFTGLEMMAMIACRQRPFT